MGEQITINGRTYKSVSVHGRCAKCGAYYEAQTYMAPLSLEFPEKMVDQPHLHLTICCYRCKGIVNLIDVSKPSLKRRRQSKAGEVLAW
jgi:hypothetical protein